MINYFGHIIQYEELISLYRIYQKETPTSKELDLLNRFKQKYYTVYDQHRDEMKNNFKKGKLSQK